MVVAKDRRGLGKSNQIAFWTKDPIACCSSQPEVGLDGTERMPCSDGLAGRGYEVWVEGTVCESPGRRDEVSCECTLEAIRSIHRNAVVFI